MATMIATPAAPNPVTGMRSPVLCWQITTATAPDLVTCLGAIAKGGWDGQVNSKSDGLDPLNNPSVWSLVITAGDYLKTQNITLVLAAAVNDWVFFDGRFVWTANNDDATAGYTMTPYPPS